MALKLVLSTDDAMIDVDTKLRNLKPRDKYDSDAPMSNATLNQVLTLTFSLAFYSFSWNIRGVEASDFSAFDTV